MLFMYSISPHSFGRDESPQGSPGELEIAISIETMVICCPIGGLTDDLFEMDLRFQDGFYL
ncbi:hypothetical protein OAL35_00545 [bacterium]|nr:hypothetical protein [bacterium]